VHDQLQRTAVRGQRSTPLDLATPLDLVPTPRR
jgi:hypothetical protein